MSSSVAGLFAELCYFAERQLHHKRMVSDVCVCVCVCVCESAWVCLCFCFIQDDLYIIFAIILQYIFMVKIGFSLLFLVPLTDKICTLYTYCRYMQQTFILFIYLFIF